MDTDQVIERLPLQTWHGPFDTEVCTQAVDALESGRVLLAELPFSMSPDEAFLLSPAIMGSERKNISYDPPTGQVANTALAGAQADSLKHMLRRFGDAAEALLRDLLPGYAAELQRARTSFRPAEIAGRDYSPRHDDRLLHVDAFPSRPMHGRRILRLFCNVAPDGIPRDWRVGEPFADFARRFLPRTGNAIVGSAWLLERLGLTKDGAPSTTASCCACTTPESWIRHISQTRHEPTSHFPLAQHGSASLTRCCMPHSPAIAPWNRHFICPYPPWQIRSARHYAFWSSSQDDH